MKRSLPISLLTALALSSTACATEITHPVRASMTRYQPGMVSPKNIYYEDPGMAGGPAMAPEQQQVAVRFWIELHPRDGAPPQLVTADRVFRSGERTRYRFAASRDCVVYVAHEGSLGDRTLLYPSPQAGLDNLVRAHMDKVMPESGGYFTFDHNPGAEHLVIVASPGRIPELDAIVTQTAQGYQQPPQGYQQQPPQGYQPPPQGYRTLTPEQNRAFSNFIKQHTGMPSGASSRNIIYEPDVSGGPQTGQYYAPADPGFNQPVVINITLQHQP